MTDCKKLGECTPTGLRLEGTFENNRNSRNRDLYKRIICEGCGVDEVIIGHHLVYLITEKREDGFEYQIVQELAGADALIFNHTIARKVFGPGFLQVLADLACTPVELRDEKLADYYYGRGSTRV